MFGLSEIYGVGSIEGACARQCTALAPTCATHTSLGSIGKTCIPLTSFWRMASAVTYVTWAKVLAPLAIDEENSSRWKGIGLPQFVDFAAVIVFADDRGPTLDDHFHERHWVEL